MQLGVTFDYAGAAQSAGGRHRSNARVFVLLLSPGHWLIVGCPEAACFCSRPRDSTASNFCDAGALASFPTSSFRCCSNCSCMACTSNFFATPNTLRDLSHFFVVIRYAFSQVFQCPRCRFFFRANVDGTRRLKIHSKSQSEPH